MSLDVHFDRKHSRPLPPGRIKRSSLSLPPNSEGSTTMWAKSSAGVLGGLRERSEEGLNRASLEELKIALKDEWISHERSLDRIEILQLDLRKAASEREEATRSSKKYQKRLEESLQEQRRLEAILENRDEVLDRLKARLGEGERALRESQRRYTEQEQSFELERNAFKSQENQLQTSVQNLRNRLNPATNSSRSSPTQEPALDSEEELASLHASQMTLLARFETLSKESQELKRKNRELEEDNAGWELLVRERTISGKMVLPMGVSGDSEEHSSATVTSEEKQSPFNDEIDLQDEMNDLHGDLEMQSPILGRDDDTFSNSSSHGKGRGQRRPVRAGDVFEKDGMLVPPGHRSRSPASASSSLGMDLAAEMSRADEDPTSGETRISMKNDESLKAEVKSLREANKALTLYCSKIIDRIIAQEGFEHILSVDYKTRRGHRSTIKKAKSRPGLKDITTSLQDHPVVTSPTVPPETPIEEKKPRKSRPLSMMFSSSSTPTSNPPPPDVAEIVPKDNMKCSPLAIVKEETKAEKRARRGFSLDLRSFGFGNTPIVPPTEPSKSRLKPLALSQRTVSRPSPLVSSPSSSSTLIPERPADLTRQVTARKLSIQEPDEDDLRERHRLEASLKLMGIEKTLSPSLMEDPEGEEVSEDRYWASSGISKPNESRPDSLDTNESAIEATPPSRETPLSRISNMLSHHRSPLSMESRRQIEEETMREEDIAELEDLEHTEEDHHRALATDMAKMNLSTSAHRVSTRNSVHGVGAGMPKSESISTLWSLGSGDGESRPTSRDFKVDHLGVGL